MPSTQNNAPLAYQNQTSGARFSGNEEFTDAQHVDEDCDPVTIGHEDNDGYLSMRSCNLSPGGYLVCGTDCNDNDPTIRPNQTEVCNGKDDNCDGYVDEGVSFTFFMDRDGDQFGNPDVTSLRCSPGRDRHGNFWTYNNTDCNDNDSSVYSRNGNCN